VNIYTYICPCANKNIYSHTQIFVNIYIHIYKYKQTSTYQGSQKEAGSIVGRVVERIGASIVISTISADMPTPI
jgi:hypothetical protein